MSDDRTMKERMLAGDLYRVDEELAEELAHGARTVQAYNATDPTDAVARREILVGFLGAVGEDTELRSPFYCEYGYNTTVGARTFSNFGLMCLDVAPVKIGDDVNIGPNVQLLTPTHPTEPGPRRDKWEGGRPITIGDNVWLGGGVVVCPGVTIGENTVVGAGAVVVNDLPADVVAVGNPARIVRHLGE
ncbi:maltose O-acetyltransferase [Paraoerskovia marina]|uniref:Maltose O-acetyltransferase n=1 Tax=Paraoerskovia marina TaxID=545619 RepID=A0A1H1M5B3_9CELL|nr:sugar O-acetyltransferase [Paraoerskovia marina]SDR82024.1 maltose O-acetyltransferase [Paraoerskovia marina]